MKKCITFMKKEMMLTVAVFAALVSLMIQPPSKDLLLSIDFKTLATLFMLLSVLDGFKHEHIFDPLLKAARNIHSVTILTIFLVFSVFFSSMFVTNDVSLIIFVPLTIVLFSTADKEHYLLPVLTFENIAAIRGSLLTPFGSPQNLFLFSKSGIDALSFTKMMFPLFLYSFIMLIIFILILYHKNIHESIEYPLFEETASNTNKQKQHLYIGLFVLILFTIVSRTSLWPYVTLFVSVMLWLFDRAVYKRVDYVLLLTFLCFFIFSGSIANNEAIGGFLMKHVANHEYWWSISLSQIISNVPASIVLWPFTTDLQALLYGLDSAGLITVIGSLASVINMRLYTKNYPNKGKDFILTFTYISILFFLTIQPLQLWLLR